MRLDWIFDKGKEYEFNLTGIWSQDYKKVVEFNRSFFFNGNHTAELTVTYGYYI